MGVKQRQFTAEFKLEAVRLASESEKPLTQVARELGLRPVMLRTWKRPAESREEIWRLRRELEQAKQEYAFLKQAAAYFARESP